MAKTPPVPNGAKEQLVNLLPSMSKYFELGGYASFSTPERPFLALHLKTTLEFEGISLPAKSPCALDNNLLLYMLEVVREGPRKYQ